MSATSLSILLEVVDKASPELKKFQKNLENTEQTLKTFTAGFIKFGAAAGTIAATGVAAMTKQAINAADILDETAQKVGMSVERLSELAYAARMNGVSFDTLTTAAKKLNQTIVEAQQPTSQSAMAFKALGISVLDANGKLKTADVVMKEIAERFKKAPDGATKTAVAMQLMGKSGAEMIPMLNAGADGIQKLVEEAHKFGLVVDKETAKSAGDFNDQLDRVQAMMGAIGLTLAKYLLPLLTNLADGFMDARKEGNDFSRFAEGVVAVFKLVIKTGSYVYDVIQVIGTGLAALAASAALLAEGNLKGAVNTLADWNREASNQVKSGDRFRESLDKVTKSVKENTTETDKNNEAAQDSIDYKSGQAEAASKLQKEYDRIIDGLVKEKAAFEKLTKEQEVNRQITEGSYSKFNQLQQQRLIQLAQEIDAAKRLKDVITATTSGYTAAFAAYAQMEQQRLEMDRGLLSAENQLRAMQGGRRRGATQDQAAAMEEALRSVTYVLLDIENQYQDAVGMAEHLSTILNENTELTKSQRDAYQEMLDIQSRRVVEMEAQLTVAREYSNTWGRQMTANAVSVRQQQQAANKELQLWNKYIGDSHQRMNDLAAAEKTAKEWLDKGKISAQEFKIIIEGINADKIAELQKGMSEFDREVNNLAKSFQDYMGDSFYNMMQGQFDWTLQGFKQMLDRMVAQALARNIANAIFGEGFSKSGMVSSGSAASGLLSSFVSMLGFRESGGPVQAGQPYIVGEKRAELFIPDVNGTIMPSLDAAKDAFSASNQISINVHAMDSQDVIRAMDKIKRPLAQMLNGTNRTYNLGV